MASDINREEPRTSEPSETESVENPLLDDYSSQSLPTSSTHGSYVRRRSPHHSQPPVDDLEQDDFYTMAAASDSNFTAKGSVVNGQGYRRSRSTMPQVKNMKYGQYLEVPKGRRSIFESPEQRKHRRNLLIVAGVLVIILVIIIFLLVTHH